MTFWSRSASATSFSVGRAVMRARIASKVDMCAGVGGARVLLVQMAAQVRRPARVVDEHEAERAQEQGDGEEPRAPGIELRLHLERLRVAALRLAVGAREHGEAGAS